MLMGHVDVVGVCAPSLGMTFDLCHGLAEAFSVVQSVNEVEDSHGMAGTVLLEERLSVCERLLIVWKWICSTHAGSGLCGCGGMSLMYGCLLVSVL